MHGQPEEDLNPTLAAGTCLGKYQVVRLIGEGGMGAGLLFKRAWNLQVTPQ